MGESQASVLRARWVEVPRRSEVASGASWRLPNETFVWRGSVELSEGPRHLG